MEETDPAVLSVRGTDRFHMLTEGDDGKGRRLDEPPDSKLVLNGRNLDATELGGGLMDCVAG